MTRRGAESGHSEIARQTVHMSMGAFALALRWVAWWQAVALATFAFLFNLFVLPRIAPRIFRAGDQSRGLHGILIYPLAVLTLLVAFPRRPDIVAAAWGVLAVGDGIATLVGRAVNGRRWSWNPNKTIAGTAAFCVAASAAAAALAWWCRGAVSVRPPVAFTIAAPIAAAVAAAFVETIPVRLDDNISVTAAAGAVLWFASLVAPHDAAGLTHGVWPAAAAAILLNAAVAFLGYRARTVSRSGAIAGALVGSVIYVSLGWRGWLLLFVTFVAASVASRLGLQRKTLLGIAEERGGRRGAGNAIGNTGVAAMASALAVLSVHPVAARLACAAALAAGGSDTIASEIGKAWGRRTWSITSLSRVPPGISGAMSVEGTLAGVVGAAMLALVAVALGVIAAPAIAPVVIGATAGALLESWLGATLEAPGILNNDMLNFINTAAAAIVALGLMAWMR